MDNVVASCKTQGARIQQQSGYSSRLLVMTVGDLFENSRNLVESQSSPHLIFEPIKFDKFHIH